MDLRQIVERFWNDVAGLPWKDKAWVENAKMREETRVHYVNATHEDLKALVEQPHLKAVVAMLDKMMEDAPNRELADVSNYLQTLLTEEEKNANTTSND